MLSLKCLRKKKKKKNSCSQCFSFNVIFSKSISRFIDALFLFNFLNRWCRDLCVDCRKKIKKQIIKCFRSKRVVVKWFYYLIDNEIIWINVFDLLTNFTMCAFKKVLQNDRDLKEEILVEKWWNDVNKWKR